MSLITQPISPSATLLDDLLFKAAERGDLNQFTDLLASDANPNAVQSTSYTAWWDLFSLFTRTETVAITDHVKKSLSPAASQPFLKVLHEAGADIDSSAYMCTPNATDVADIFSSHESYTPLFASDMDQTAYYVSDDEF